MWWTNAEACQCHYSLLQFFRRVSRSGFCSLQQRRFPVAEMIVCGYTCNPVFPLQEELMEHLQGKYTPGVFGTRNF